MPPRQIESSKNPSAEPRIVFTWLSPEDVGSIAELCAHERGDVMSHERLFESLSPRTHRVLVASTTETPRRLVAFVESQLVVGELEILDVITASTHRRRGIARGLLTELITRTRPEGLTRVLLEVRVSNTPALTLYRAMGFESDSIRRGYYHDGEDACLMSRTIEPVDCLPRINPTG